MLGGLIVACAAGLVVLLEAKGCGTTLSVLAPVALALAYAQWVRALDARAVSGCAQDDDSREVSR